MHEVSILGLELTKNYFNAHGNAADGSVLFRRKLSRAQRLDLVSNEPPSIVAIEACASAHLLGRAIGSFCHDVRLIPPAYVMPCVKRQ